MQGLYFNILLTKQEFEDGRYKVTMSVIFVIFPALWEERAGHTYRAIVTNERGQVYCQSVTEVEDHAHLIALNNC